MRLQTHKRQLKLNQMEEKKTISEITTRTARLVNQVKARGETITKHYIFTKILHSLTPKFDNVVVVIEESKDLTTMGKEELQISLEAHEQRMEEKNGDKAKAKITLQARFIERNKKAKGKWPMNKDRGNFQNFGGRESQNSKNSTF